MIMRSDDGSRAIGRSDAGLDYEVDLQDELDLTDGFIRSLSAGWEVSCG